MIPFVDLTNLVFERQLERDISWVSMITQPVMSCSQPLLSATNNLSWVKKQRRQRIATVEDNDLQVYSFRSST